MKRTKPVAKAILLVAVVTGIAAAQPSLKLPPPPTTVTGYTSIGDPAAPTTTSYAVTTLANVPAGYDISDKAYMAWCADQFAKLGSNQQYQVYNTYDPNLPANAQSLYWPNVNWILNNKPQPLGPTESQTIAEAIWFLLNGQFYDKSQPPSVVATWTAYVNQALQHSNFVPGPGQVVAILLYVDGLRSTTAQDIIIEVPVPPTTTGCTGTIGDFVWNDVNANGIQDAGEPGINGVTVQLYKTAVTGSPRQTTVTANAPSGYTFLPAGSKGYYQFKNVCSGDYIVVVDSGQPALSGYVPSPSLQGSDRRLDSNGSPANVHLQSNRPTDETIDFGFHSPTSPNPPTLSCSASTGQVGTFYSSSLVASGGTSPYKFSAVGLPSFLTLDATSGLLSGTPTSPGSFNFTAKVVDASNSAAGTTVQSCTINVPSVCVIAANTIGSDPVSWNKFNTQGANNVVWIHAHIGTPSGLSSGVTTVNFTGVTFVLNGQTYHLPDGTLKFDPAAGATTTSFDANNGQYGRWTTTLNPGNLSDEIFFDGNAILVDGNISGGGQATFNYTTNSSSPNLSFSWQWSAAVYTFWPGNNGANIEPVHANQHAGAPLNTAVQQTLIQGPRGGGGSNFTGSWSGTGHGSCPSH